jgi:small-conductance mechanosensitive channel
MMEYLHSAFGLMGEYALLLGPGAGIILGGLLLVATIEKFFRDRPAFARRHALFRGGASLFILSCAIVWAIFLLPVDHDTRAQLVTLLAVVISAILTLSSATFVGNALAGLMLRVMAEFRPGDMIRVDDTIGRVAEEGVFHAEIQTADGALVIIPNITLVTSPVTVLRAGKGTAQTADRCVGEGVENLEGKNFRHYRYNRTTTS